MTSERLRMTTAARPGRRRSERAAWRRSWRKASMASSVVHRIFAHCLFRELAALLKDRAQEPSLRVLARRLLAHQDEKRLLDDLLRLPRGDAVIGEDAHQERSHPLQELRPGFVAVHDQGL